MNTQVRAFIVISTVTLFGLATPAMAVVNWYNSSAADNSGGATVPIDGTTTTPSGWVDTFFGTQATGQSGQQNAQANGPATSQINPPLVNSQPNYMAFGFGNLGIAAGSTINAASLNVSANNVGVTQTYTIYGLTGTVDNNLEWANANFNPTTANTYGTFTSFTGSGTVDLSSAIQAYVNGVITGIAIGTTDSAGAFNINDNYLTFATSENSNTALRPSLMVDFVPEPSTYALIFGLVALVGVVRRRKNRSSSMPMPA
ncbi:MAG: hypothetical protein CNE95_01080 [Puniceicoccaceae bacterium MED-G30]|nr:MAG: hypothetical protein CNE95_01080 [Puniceicoccaceae bacterium MED-G30]